MQRSGIYVLYRPVTDEFGNWTNVNEYRAMVPYWRVEGGRVISTSSQTLNHAVRHTKQQAFDAVVECESDDRACDKGWRVGELISDRILGVRVEE